MGYKYELIVFLSPACKQMEVLHTDVCLRLLGSFLLHTALLVCINLQGFDTSATPSNDTDHLALLAFKDQISKDASQVLSSWNDSLHFCRWVGVTCSKGNPQRVTALNLTGQRMEGLLSPHISNLSFLQALDLSKNGFQGEIPHELRHLFRLQLLNLSSNSFNGGIPRNLTLCKQLRVLELNDNKLDGHIPFELGSLTKLQTLKLDSNKFIGHIPPSLGNLSSLTQLYLSKNSLVGGIPDEVRRIAGLQFLSVHDNNLSGMVPSSLYNLSTIISLDVGNNQLHGDLPSDLGLTLPRLEKLSVSSNHFTGPIPVSLGNNTRIEHLDFSYNNFTGPVPLNLGRLHRLKLFNFGHNNLTGDLGFITSLTNCSRLEIFSVLHNDFVGVLPNSVANLSTHLQRLQLGQNQIYGSIPKGIGNLLRLYDLQMQLSLLTGPIPDGLGKLQKLDAISFHDNNLSGEIPLSIGNLTRLFGVHLQNNNLEGSIPQSLGKCQSLQWLRLWNNKLNGTIPEQVLNIASLIEVRLDRNFLTGPLSLDVNKLKSLTELNVTNNRLSGEIPIALGNCISLKNVNMRSNLFQGSIPSSLSSLRVLQELDLSQNNISGQIPGYLGQLPFLEILNLSFNNLVGELPKTGIFQNESAVSVLGNARLCGGAPKLELPECPRQPSKNRVKALVIVFGVVAAVLGLLFSCFLVRNVWLKKSRKQLTSTSFRRNNILELSYSMLFKATDEFSLANLIGVGSYGSVYKGYLECIGTVVAIKVLNLRHRRASKSFKSECEALRNIQHRNVIKILTVCSSIDFRGNDFKALVFEYMPNGSLDIWLHHDETEDVRNLSLLERLNIAIDVANALDYLHHHCQEPVVHCDLKPSNILLDDDMVAHLGDFGLAKILFKDVANNYRDQSSTLEIKGSIGYVAPEYGMGGHASTSGDVYSYGILLLEMLTGKRPTDDMFKGNQNLHQFAKTAFPERVLEIVDRHLLLEGFDILECDQSLNKMSSRTHGSLISLVRIGLSCSAETPKERMNMKDVVTELQGTRDFYLSVRKS